MAAPAERSTEFSITLGGEEYRIIASHEGDQTDAAIQEFVSSHLHDLVTQSGIEGQPGDSLFISAVDSRIWHIGGADEEVLGDTRASLIAEFANIVLPPNNTLNDVMVIPKAHDTARSWATPSLAQLPIAKEQVEQLTAPERKALNTLRETVESKGENLGQFRRCSSNQMKCLAKIAATIAGNNKYYFSFLAIAGDGSAEMQEEQAPTVRDQALRQYAGCVDQFEKQQGKVTIDQAAARFIFTAGRRPLDKEQLSTQLDAVVKPDGCIDYNEGGCLFQLNIMHMLQRHTFAHFDHDQVGSGTSTTFWPVHFTAAEVMTLLCGALTKINASVQPGASPCGKHRVTVGLGDQIPGKFAVALEIDGPFDGGAYFVVTFYPSRGPGVLELNRTALQEIQTSYKRVKAQQGGSDPHYAF